MSLWPVAAGPWCAFSPFGLVAPLIWGFLNDVDWRHGVVSFGAGMVGWPMIVAGK